MRNIRERITDFVSPGPLEEEHDLSRQLRRGGAGLVALSMAAMAVEAAVGVDFNEVFATSFLSMEAGAGMVLASTLIEGDE